VSAFATNSWLVLGHPSTRAQEAVFEKSNEITAIPALIERLDLVGALVSIDAMGCRSPAGRASKSDRNPMSPPSLRRRDAAVFLAGLHNLRATSPVMMPSGRRGPQKTGFVGGLRGSCASMLTS